MEENEIEMSLIRLGNIGELIERKVVMASILPFDIYEISVKSINKAMADCESIQLKIDYLQEQKNRLIKSKSLYGHILNSSINYNGDISAIGDIVKFIDEKLKEAPRVENKEKAAKLTLPQIALIFCYESKSITRSNMNEYAKDYGHNSGEKLYQKFSKYSSRQNRIGLEASKKLNLNKLELFEKVIQNLQGEPKERATDEMKTFKAAFESGY